MKKKYWVIIILAIILLIFARHYFFKTTVISVGCKFPIKVAGDSMEPTFKNGNILFATKCFEEHGLNKGVVVVYKLGNSLAFGRIYKIEENNYHVKGDNLMNTHSDRITHKEEIIGMIKG